MFQSRARKPTTRSSQRPYLADASNLYAHHHDAPTPLRGEGGTCARSSTETSIRISDVVAYGGQGNVAGYLRGGIRNRPRNMRANPSSTWGRRTARTPWQARPILDHEERLAPSGRFESSINDRSQLLRRGGGSLSTGLWPRAEQVCLQSVWRSRDTPGNSKNTSVTIWFRCRFG
jgi:hypothetical protein